MAIRVTMIGGGAASFVPPLLRMFINSEELGDAQLTLMDVDPEPTRLGVDQLLGELDHRVEAAPSTSASPCAMPTS